MNNDPQAFNFVDPDYFEPLSRYKPSSEYRDALREVIPADWETHQEGMWLSASPPNVSFALQGFKIHVSAINPTALETMRRAVPACVERGVPFKTASDPFLLSFLNSKQAGRSGSGKFMTIYPPTPEVFHDLIADLAARTEELEGPYILSDRRYRDSKCVFYRYGGFLRRYTVNPDGQQVLAIEGVDGDLIPDLRNPYFTLPEGIEDPFPSDGAATPGPVVLNGRFEVVEAITFSNSGGVYKALDRLTGRDIVLKEARPLTNAWTQTEGFIDSVQILEREYEMLVRLESTDAVVRPVALFQEWEHTFLAEEFVQGQPLRTFRAQEGLMVAAYMEDRERVHRFCSVFHGIAGNLIEALLRVHAEGIVFGDLSPNNIMMQEDGLSLTLIDLESAHCPGDTMSNIANKWYTPGFRPVTELGRRPVTPADDFYAAGMCLYSMLFPAQGFFDLHPAARPKIINRYVSVGMPHEVRDVILALVDGQPQRALALLDDWTSVDGRLLDASALFATSLTETSLAA